jgi:hypothetical protein
MLTEEQKQNENQNSFKYDYISGQTVFKKQDFYIGKEVVFSKDYKIHELNELSTIDNSSSIVSDIEGYDHLRVEIIRFWKTQYLTKICTNCKNRGHIRGICPLHTINEEEFCRYCHMKGHSFEQCLKKKKIICNKCFLQGHKAKECTTKLKNYVLPRRCNKCQGINHNAEDCLVHPDRIFKDELENCFVCNHSTHLMCNFKSTQIIHDESKEEVSTKVCPFCSKNFISSGICCSKRQKYKGSNNL